MTTTGVARRLIASALGALGVGAALVALTASAAPAGALTPTTHGDARTSTAGAGGHLCELT